jgi:hypothetical protein
LLWNDGLVDIHLLLGSVGVKDPSEAGLILLPGGDALKLTPSSVTLVSGQKLAVTLEFCIQTAGPLEFEVCVNLVDSAKDRTWMVYCTGMTPHRQLSNQS